MRVNGVQCDWCGAIEDCEGDMSVPPGWSKLTLRTYPPTNGQHAEADDLCPACAESAGCALRKTRKQRETGKVQR
jgi:hypothetical protein